MTILSYRLTEPVEPFDEGRVLELTARFGDWHVHDVKLEPTARSDTRTVELDWEELRSVSKPAEATAW